VDEVVERSVDVLVMGLAYGKRFGECDLGETAEYVLRHTPCQVWLVREAAVALEGDRADESR
jgi:nucleotide-binding universal stress UspA family protein